MTVKHTQIIQIDSRHLGKICFKCNLELKEGDQLYRKRYDKGLNKTKYYHIRCYERLFQ